MQAIATTSPRRIARLTALFSVLTVLTAMFAQGYVAERLFVRGDAAGTAQRILAHTDLLRMGFVVFMIEMACNIAVMSF